MANIRMFFLQSARYSQQKLLTLHVMNRVLICSKKSPAVHSSPAGNPYLKIVDNLRTTIRPCFNNLLCKQTGIFLCTILTAYHH